MKTICYLIVIGFSIPCFQVFGQDTGGIEGKVTDAVTGEAMIGTNIQIAWALTGTTTDIDGGYKLVGLEEGTYTIKVSFISYQPKEVQVSVIPGQATMQDFKIAHDLLGLDRVIVTGVINQKSALESSVALTSVKPKFIQELGPQKSGIYSKLRRTAKSEFNKRF